MIELVVSSIILLQIGGKLYSEQVHLQEKNFIDVVCQNIWKSKQSKYIIKDQL